MLPTSPTGSERKDDAAGDALARCVGDPDRFVAQFWARAPLYRPAADAAAFADLFSLGDVDHILSSTTPRYPAFRMVKDGKQLNPRSYTMSGRVGGQPVDDLADPGGVYELFHGGATIVLQSLHRFWPPLARLAATWSSPLPILSRSTPTSPHRPHRGSGSTTTSTTCSCCRCTDASSGTCTTPTASPRTGWSWPSWPQGTTCTSPSAFPMPPGRPRPPRST